MQKKVCGTMIKQLHDAMERDANNVLRTKGLTVAQVGVLLELYSTPKKQMPLKELEHILHVAQSTAAGIVVRLEQKGLVESFGDSADRRIKIVRLTQTGETCCIETNKDMIQSEKKFLEPLTEKEQTALISLLEKICDSKLKNSR